MTVFRTCRNCLELWTLNLLTLIYALNYEPKVLNPLISNPKKAFAPSRNFRTWVPPWALRVWRYKKMWYGVCYMLTVRWNDIWRHHHFLWPFKFQCHTFYALEFTKGEVHQAKKLEKMPRLLFSLLVLKRISLPFIIYESNCSSCAPSLC